MTNHAILAHESGAPDVLRFERIADPPPPGPGEVLLVQGAIGVNYLDIYFRNGDIAPASFPFVNGFEGAGTVEAVGEGVENVRPGDRVGYFLAAGAYAERRIVPADRLVVLPDDITDAEAAAMLLKGCTAEYLVRESHPVAPGDTVLIHAAAGGVGSILVQWAKHLGAAVIGTVSTAAKAQHVRELGCDHAIVTGDEDFVERVNDLTHGLGVTVVYDGVGRTTFERNFDCLATFGTNVLFGWASGRVAPLDVYRLNARSHRMANPSVGDHAGTPARLAASTAALFDVVRGGAVRIPVAHEYALADAALAHTDLEARRTSGSIVLRVDATDRIATRVHVHA